MKQAWDSVIFFDLDNTLMEGPFESAVFPAVFRELSEKTGQAPAEIRRQVVRENLERQKRADISAVLSMDWDDIFNTIATRLGVSLETNALEIVKTHVTPPDSILFEQAAEVLRELSKPGRAILAATKGLRKYQLPILEGLGLSPLFTEILTPDSNNALKQDLAFYGAWATSTRLQISVGDHYLDDLTAPQSFGFKTIWKPGKQSDEIKHFDPFERPAHYSFQDGQLVRPDAILVSLTELPAIIARLEKTLRSSSDIIPAPLRDFSRSAFPGL
jgi:FMN phosphatase YigB (HAD superfamily)